MRFIFKVLPALLVVIVIGGAFYYFKFMKVDHRLGILERRVDNLPARWAEAFGTATESAQNIKNEITQKPQEIQAMVDEAVKKAIANIKPKTTIIEKVTKQEATAAPASTAATATPGVGETYVPLGSSGQTSSQTYTTITTLSATIDSSKYPANAKATLTANMSLKDANGTGYARLVAGTDKNEIIFGSEMSTTAQTLTPVTSGSFVLHPGNQTYYVQLYSLTGYQVTIESPRIKIASQ